jgi:hypothetical protein
MTCTSLTLSAPGRITDAVQLRSREACAAIKCGLGSDTVDNRAECLLFLSLFIELLSSSSFFPLESVDQKSRQDGEQILQELSSLHTDVRGVHGLIALWYGTVLVVNSMQSLLISSFRL